MLQTTVFEDYPLPCPQQQLKRKHKRRTREINHLEILVFWQMFFFRIAVHFKATKCNLTSKQVNYLEMGNASVMSFSPSKSE